MFEQLEELINNKIERDMQEYDKRQVEKEDVENSILTLLNYEVLKYELKADKIRMIVSIGGLIISLVCIPLSLSVNIMSTVINVMISLYSLLKLIEYREKLPLVNNCLCSLYRECLEIAENELKNVGKLEDYKYRIDNEKIIANDFWLTSEVLDEVKIMLKNRKNCLECVISELDQSIKENIYRVSYFDKEELVNCFSDDISIQTYNNLLDSYLNEKVDCSSVRFNKELEQDSKKLLKKI